MKTRQSRGAQTARQEASNIYLHSALAYRLSQSQLAMKYRQLENIGGLQNSTNPLCAFAREAGMSLPAARPLARLKHSLLQNDNERNGTARAAAACVPSAVAMNKITKPKWTSKRTRRQFFPISCPERSEPKRQDEGQPATLPESANLVGALPPTVGLVATGVLPPAKLNEQSRRPEAPAPTGGEPAAVNPNTKSPSRVQTNEPPERPRDPASLYCMEDVTMSSDAAYMPGVVTCTLDTNTNSDDSVPRSFERANITIPSNIRDKEMPAAHAPAFRTKVVSLGEFLRALAPVDTVTNHDAHGKAAALAKTEPPSPTPQRHPRPQPSSSNIGQDHEIIYISDSDDDPCLPIMPSTLEESSRERPTEEPKADLKNIAAAANTDHRVVAAESSDDDIPLAHLRRKRLCNKHKLSASETQFAMVNRPMPAFRPSTTARKPFDSNKFDAEIYKQNGMQPPRGVKIVRPTPPSRVGAEDDTLYVYGNPAIHRSLVRSEQWWKDKAQQIRGRPNRKKWFGKVTQRLRWLHEQELQEEMRRRPRTRGSAGRSPRRDPQAAGYSRIMDFGDVPEHQLPLYVQNNPAWVKACVWMRQSKERDEAMQRVVEHGTQVLRQNYENLWSEDD